MKLTKECESPQADENLYHQLVKTLIYLTHSRPYISFAVSVVSCFMQDPKESHWKAVKHIVCYLKGTSHFGIKYSHSTNSLVNYTDSDSDCDGDDQKSTFCYIFHFSSRPLVRFCKKQKDVSSSTTEAEYRGVVNSSTEVVWI